ncbi:MAG: hypothetical protein RSE19_10405, partial [Myroides sp.]
MENNQKLEELIKRLEELSRKHELFTREINNLRSEIYSLKLGQSNIQTKDPSEIIEVKPKISEQFIPVSEPKVLAQNSV